MGGAELGARSGCEVADVTEANAVLAVNGPRSREILNTMTDGSLDNDAFPPYTARQLRVASTDCLALRVSFAGELGWELHVPAGEASRVYETLLEVGRPYGLIPAGTFALLNSLRIEKGFVHYGGDVTQAETPLEAGLGFACKLKVQQPDFLGKEAILARRRDGWRARLVSFRLPSFADVSLWGHDQELLYRNGEHVGVVTSGGYSHTLGCAIGMGYLRGPPKVPQDWISSGTYEVEAPVRGVGDHLQLQRFPVDISTRCVLDPDGARVRRD